MPRTKAGIFKRATSPYWYIKVQDARGRWIMRSTRTRRYSEARAIFDRVKSGEPVRLFAERRTPSFPVWATFYLRTLRDNERRPSTIESAALAVRHLARRFRGRALDRITTGDVEAYKRRRRADGVAAQTVNRELLTLGALFRLAVERGVLEHVPCRIVKLPRERRTHRPSLGPDARRRLWAACQTDRERLMVVLALETGLRRSELTWLTWEDVDLEGRVLWVRGKADGSQRWAPKNRQERAVPLSPNATNALRRAIARGEATQGRWVLRSRNGGRLRSPAKGIRALFRRAGIYQKGLTLHALRHTFATEALAAGNDLETVRELMGHAEVATTGRYLHADEARKRAAVEGLNLSRFGAVRGAAPKARRVVPRVTPRKSPK